MKIVIISKFINHHHLPLSLKLAEKYGSEFLFIETGEIQESNIKTGYKDLSGLYSFVIKLETLGEKKVVEYINSSELVIFADSNYDLLKTRSKMNKPIYFYTERIFKNNNGKFMSLLNILRFIKYKKIYKNLDKSESYLLCAGSYVARDFEKMGLFKNRKLKFGYFPEPQNIEYNTTIKSNTEKINILWVGRMLKWKRPFDLVKSVKILIEKHKITNFKVTMIGEGEERIRIEEYINQNKLQKYFNILDFMSSDKVKQYYSISDIFIFTSNYKEGWGAVLNEAMFYKNAIIASTGAGSTNYLIENKVNGLTYNQSNIQELTYNLKLLILNKDLRDLYSRNSKYTITSEWSVNIISERLFELVENKMCNPMEYQKGPLSKA